MEVYSDIFQLGDGFIQTEGEPGGLHKANPIILGSFGGHYDSDGKLVGDRRRRRILFEDTFEEMPSPACPQAPPLPAGRRSRAGRCSGAGADQL